MKTDKYLLFGSGICMLGAIAFNWRFWGMMFAIYSLVFLSLGLMLNVIGINSNE